MPTPTQLAALSDFYTAAIQAGHIHPAAAACEAALESAWGSSRLAREANNLFGQKQFEVPIHTTLALATRECVAGRWTTCTADWVVFPTVAACFAARMALLRRLPRYAPALAAPTPVVYLRAVSPAWSTDPDRARHCLDIFARYGASLSPQLLVAQGDPPCSSAPLQKA